MLISTCMSFGLITLLSLHIYVATAISTNRNPLTRIGYIQNVEVRTPSQRVTAASSFNLLFDCDIPYGPGRIRLSLEPNHDLFPEDATVEYLGSDGSVVQRDVLDRAEYRVFKGQVWTLKEGKPNSDKDSEEDWRMSGYTRITVYRDREYPVFEGMFSIMGDQHHILRKDTWNKHRQDGDPKPFEGLDGESMVLWRDSDISPYPYGYNGNILELKRDANSDVSCGHDALEFNMQPDHPIHATARQIRHERERSKRFWSAPIDDFILGMNENVKRQMDTTSSGNSAGVDLSSTIGQTDGCPSTRKVALVGVAADCNYMAAFDTKESARQNIISAINSASGAFESSFNIMLGLQNLTLSDGSCSQNSESTTPWNLACSDDVSLRDRLNLFSMWRGEREDDGNSHWTLLTTCKIGTEVGLAWLGQACVSSSTSTSDTSGEDQVVSGANVVVVTDQEWQVIAHETGHTFGAVHDCVASTCDDGVSLASQQCCPLSADTCDSSEMQYLMNPTSSSGIESFSPCTVGNICSAIGRNSVNTQCLVENNGVTTISGQQCGNGIVEEGEDCDCGGEDGCDDNTCCDATTCTFIGDATCDDSNEDCCINCQFASADRVCRSSTGECDPEETCTGDSSTCPDDVTADDGVECGDEGENLQCASGQCTSRDLQCMTVMSSFITGSNDTFACDDESCILSCQSPEFEGQCFGLQQNFLDGTNCGSGGRCSNGQCIGSSVTDAIKSWIDNNLSLVIGLASVGGVLILVLFSCCFWRSIVRRKQRQQNRLLFHSNRNHHNMNNPDLHYSHREAEAWPKNLGPYDTRVPYFMGHNQKFTFANPSPEMNKARVPSLSQPSQAAERYA